MKSQDMAAWRRDALAVLGSAHIDIVGYSRDRKENLDKIGDIEMRLGGAAYHAAIYLAREGKRVKFWTLLKNQSLVERWILSKLRSEKINTRYITRRRDVGIGTFLAIKHQGEHLAAVTHVTVDKVSLPRGKIGRMISRSGAILADCNLSVGQLCELLKLSRSRHRPISFAGVSEARVLRYVNAAEITADACVFALAVDALIFESIRSHLKEQGISSTEQIAKILKVKVLAVFDGLASLADKSGSTARFRFFFGDGTQQDLSEFVPGEAKTTGGRDALGAALAAISARSGSDLTPQQIMAEFRQSGWPIVARVLRGERSDLGEIPGNVSVESFGIESSAPSFYLRIVRTLSLFFARTAQLIVGLVGFAAALYELFPESVKPILESIVDRHF